MELVSGIGGESLLIALLSIVCGVAVVVAAWAWRWLQEQRLDGWAGLLVREAEQALGESTGEEKLAYVLGKLQELFPRLDVGLIRSVIEAKVFDIHKAAGAAGAAGGQPVAPAATLLQIPECRYGLRVDREQ